MVALAKLTWTMYPKELGYIVLDERGQQIVVGATRRWAVTLAMAVAKQAGLRVRIVERDD